MLLKLWTFLLGWGGGCWSTLSTPPRYMPGHLTGATPYNIYKTTHMCDQHRKITMTTDPTATAVSNLKVKTNS